jgi:hypothetical protein
VSRLTFHHLVLPRADIPTVPNIIVHRVSHAQGYHNLSEENHELPDPSLTGLGEVQCEALQNVFPYHDKVTARRFPIETGNLYLLAWLYGGS